MSNSCHCFQKSLNYHVCLLQFFRTAQWPQRPGSKRPKSTDVATAIGHSVASLIHPFVLLQTMHCKTNIHCFYSQFPIFVTSNFWGLVIVSHWRVWAKCFLHVLPFRLWCYNPVLLAPGWFSEDVCIKLDLISCNGTCCRESLAWRWDLICEGAMLPTLIFALVTMVVSLNGKTVPMTSCCPEGSFLATDEILGEEGRQYEDGGWPRLHTDFAFLNTGSRQQVWHYGIQEKVLPFDAGIPHRGWQTSLSLYLYL